MFFKQVGMVDNFGIVLFHSGPWPPWNQTGERSNTGKTVSQLAVDIQNMTPSVD